MRVVALLPLSLATLLLGSAALPSEAAAQSSGAPGASGVHRTETYVEQNLGGDQIVKFTGDELVGPAGGAYGDVIRRPPGVSRVGLIRPRMNFVSELLKSVENL